MRLGPYGAPTKYLGDHGTIQMNERYLERIQVYELWWLARARACPGLYFFFPFLCPSVNWPPVASAPTNQPWKNGLLIIYRLDLTLSVTAAGHLHSSLFYTMVIKSGRVMSVPFTTKWNSVRSFVRSFLILQMNSQLKIASAPTRTAQLFSKKVCL